MPKVLPRPEDKFKNFLLANIEYQYKLRGISQEEQRLVARCSKSTYRLIRLDPGKFTLEQLIRISKKLNIPLWKLLKEDEQLV